MLAKTIQVSKDKLHIPIIGDIQYAKENSAFVPGKLDYFMGVCKRYIADRKADTWFVGTGDYIDFMSPSNRAMYRAAGIYSSSKRLVSTGVTVPQIEQLYKDHLRPMKGRTAALCVGHHYSDFDFEGMSQENRYKALKLLPEDHRAGGGHLPQTSDAYLGAILGAPISRPLGMYIISFKFPEGAKYRMLAWHGEGGGATMGYMINKLIKLSGGWEKINAIAAGHTHRLLAGFDVKLMPSEEDDKILDRNIPLINSGSYLSAYLLGDQAYPEVKGLNPLALGSAVLSVEPYKRHGEWAFHTEISLHA